ncbi:hypothetical protein UFOVP326_60 [uncultured Caudovirales phage]|uniref:Uncharacterized protein n=1 Tax=uncultured Caudovirales phage TaxID=2100421 RepID=A0A6J5LTC2_9CAUD|nr:hypothetical protein UFOVP326_60 [uncultured Caudovirales phage]
MASQAGYTVTTTPAKYLEERPGRRRLTIQNKGAVALLVGLGSAANAGSTPALSIAVGGMWDPPAPPGDAVWLAAASSTCLVSIIED